MLTHFQSGAMPLPNGSVHRFWHGREDSNPELRFWRPPFSRLNQIRISGEGLSPLPLCGFPYTVKCAILDANVATLSRAMVRFRPISKSPVRVGSISIEMGVPLV